MPGMPREKQLPTPPPDRRESTYSTNNGTRNNTSHNKASSQDSLNRRGMSGSSIASTGAKRTAYGSGIGASSGLKKVDVNDDLFIRLLAQNAMSEVQQSHILDPEEVEDLKNV